MMMMMMTAQQQQQQRQQQRLKDWLTNSKNDDTSSAAATTTTTAADDDESYVINNNDDNILLMDGGVSTHLENLLPDDGENKKFPIRELWSSSLLLSKSGQSTILQGHKDWIHSGSNIITTVTYQCHFGVDGVDTTVSNEEMISMISTGIKLAGQAVAAFDTASDDAATSDAAITESGKQTQTKKKKKVYVVGSSGCYGAALADGSEYTGNYGKSIQILEDFHRKKVNAFLLNNNNSQLQKLDGIAIETIPSLLEIEAVCNVIIEAQQQQQHQTTTNDSSDIAYWISLACCDGSTLNDGSKIVKALDIIKQKDPTAKYIHGIGINCCDSLYVNELVQKITEHMAMLNKYDNDDDDGPKTRQRCHHINSRGIIIYPNSGEEWDATNETWKSGTGIRRSNIDGNSDSDNGSSLFTDRLQNAIKVIRDTWKKEKITASAVAKEENNNSSSDQLSPPPPPRIIIGGCCRTTPSEIQALRKWIDNEQ